MTYKPDLELIVKTIPANTALEVPKGGTMMQLKKVTGDISLRLNRGDKWHVGQVINFKSVSFDEFTIYNDNDESIEIELWFGSGEVSTNIVQLSEGLTDDRFIFDGDNLNTTDDRFRFHGLAGGYNLAVKDDNISNMYQMFRGTSSQNFPIQGVGDIRSCSHVEVSGNTTQTIVDAITNDNGIALCYATIHDAGTGFAKIKIGTKELLSTDGLVSERISLPYPMVVEAGSDLIVESGSSDTKITIFYEVL